MKKSMALLIFMLIIFIVAGCNGDGGSGSGDNAGNGGALEKKDIIGIYAGDGSITRHDVVRTQVDIDNQRYLFITGNEKELGEFSGIEIEIEDLGDDNEIYYRNKITGGGNSLIYNEAKDSWEGTVDYPLGSVTAAMNFYKDGGEIHGDFTFVQSFERESFENPEPSDGVNEYKIYLIKQK